MSDEFHDAEDLPVVDSLAPNIKKKKKNNKKKNKKAAAEETESQASEVEGGLRSESFSEASSYYDDTKEDQKSEISLPPPMKEISEYLEGKADHNDSQEREDPADETISVLDEGDREVDVGVEVEAIGNTSPSLPDRKSMKDVLRMDLPTATIIESSESLVLAKASQSAGSRAVSSNFLLESKFTQLDKDFQAKDSKSKEYIQSGTQSIKKTFKDIKDTVGGFGDMFGYKIDWEFWTKVVNDYQLVVLNDTEELNESITKGIPKEFRGIIWQLISKSKNFQLEEFYIQLKNETSIHEKAIKRDLTRTSFFTHVEQVGKLEELFNVIKAYLLFDPDVGYTQGMIFVGVPLIMNMTDLECFCILVTIMKEYNLRSLFSPEMKGLHLLLYEFDRLLEMYCPRLFNHLVKQGIKSSMFALQWFLTFFAYKFPLDIVLRIYDIVITQGMESILKFAINLMIKNESNLLTLRFDKLLEFLKDKLFNYYVNEEYVEGNNGENNGTGSSMRASRTASVSRRFSILGKRNSTTTSTNTSSSNNGYYKLDLLVSDSMEINVLPFDLKKFENEFENIYVNEKAKEKDIEELRITNGELRHEIKELETQYSNLHRDHVEIMQEMVDLKVSLPEVKSDNMDLESVIDQLRDDLEDLESKIKESSGSPDEGSNDKHFDDINLGLKSPSLPTNIESDINELLLINAQETERFANLEDELDQLLQEDEKLDQELEILKGNKKWFRW